MRPFGFALWFMWLAVGSIVAQPAQMLSTELPESLEELDLETAIEIGLSRSYAVKEARIEQQMAELQIKQTGFWRSLIRAVNLSVTGGYDPLLPDSRIGAGLSFNPEPFVTDRMNRAQAETRRASATLHLKAAQDRATLDIAQAFLSYREALEKVALYEKSLVDSVKLGEVVRIRFESGQAQLDALLRIQQQTRQDAFALHQAKAEQKLTEIALRQLLEGG